MKTIYLKISLMLMTMFLYGQSALAQTVAIDSKAPSSLGELKVADNDASLIVLKSLFGGLLEGTNSDDAVNNPLVNAVATFNVCVLLIGGILAAYTILAGVIGTAYDGKMLGQQFSSAWLPIRYTIGVALILPIVGKGYAIIQLIVMWLIVRGVAVADNVWLSYVEGNVASIKEQVISPSLMNTADYQKNVLNLFAASICYKTHTSNIHAAAAQLGQSVIPNTDQWISRGKSDGFSNVQESSVKSRNADFICGRISYKEDVVLKSGTGGNADSSATGRFSKLVNVMGSDIDLSPVNKYHTVAIQEVRAETDTYAAKVLSEGLLDTQAGTVAVATELAKIAEKYKQSVAEKITKSDVIDKAGNSMIESAKENGWFLAGTWFIKFVHLNEAISRAANNIPFTQTYMTFYGTNGELAVGGGLAVDRSRGTKGIARQQAGGRTGALSKVPNLSGLKLDNPLMSVAPINVVNVKADGTVGVDDKNLDDGSSILQSIMLKFGKIMTGIDLKELKNNRTNVIVILGDIGNQLMVSASMLMAGSVAIGAGSMLLPGIAGVLSLFGAFMAPLAATLWATAFTAAYMIPMMPFLLWIGAIIGWIVLVVEAIIAAPLWAVMHLHPDGNNMYGRGGNGYSLVLALLLRPVLLIFGFIAALAITQVMGELINRVFYDVLINSVSGSTGDGMSFVAILFGLLIYITLLTTFVTKMFSVTTMIADNLLKWMGGQTEQLGSFAGEFGQASQKASGEMTQFAHSATIGISRGSKEFGGAMRGLLTSGLSGAGGAAGQASWSNQEGGFDALDAKQQQDATKAFEGWKGLNPNSNWGIQDYVGYVQSQRASANSGPASIASVGQGLVSSGAQSTPYRPTGTISEAGEFVGPEMPSSAGDTQPVNYKENDGPQLPHWRDTSIKYNDMPASLKKDADNSYGQWLANNNATRLAEGKTAKASMNASEYVQFVQDKTKEKKEGGSEAFGGTPEINRASDWRNTTVPFEELPKEQQEHANQTYQTYVGKRVAKEQKVAFGDVHSYMNYIRKKNEEAPDVNPATFGKGLLN